MPDAAWAVDGCPPGSSQDGPVALVLTSTDGASTHKRQRACAHRSSSRPTPGAIEPVAVGTALRLVGSGCPPRRSQRARLTHWAPALGSGVKAGRSEEHTSELQSRRDLVCRLLLEKKK